jgi:hypothetical protein
MKSIVKTLFSLFLIVSFVVGGYVYSTTDIPAQLSIMETSKLMSLFPQETCSKKKEGFEADKKEESACPDLLIKSGAELHLFNTKKPNKEGENPVVFKNLDEYIEYLEIQRKKGTICPILYLQKENDAQGKDVYRARPSPFNTGAGLPLTAGLNQGVNQTPITAEDASRDGKYNQNNYAGFDPYGLYVGRVTNIDKIGESTENSNPSDNPMDPNWGGVIHTYNAVESGKYDENIVSRVSYPNARN